MFEYFFLQQILTPINSETFRRFSQISILQWPRYCIEYLYKILGRQIKICNDLS